MPQGKEVLKKGRFPHTRKPPHRCGQVELWNFRVEHSNKCNNKYSEGKMEKIHHRDLTSRKVAHMPMPTHSQWG